MLQGKLKEKFEEWYFENYCQSSLKFKELLPHHKNEIFGWFYSQKIAMQKGVILEFLDSVGIECFYQAGFNTSNSKRDGIDYNVYYKNKLVYCGCSTERIDAFKKTVNIACQFYNSGCKKLSIINHQ